MPPTVLNSVCSHCGGPSGAHCELATGMAERKRPIRAPRRNLRFIMVTAKVYTPVLASCDGVFTCSGQSADFRWLIQPNAMNGREPAVLLGFISSVNCGRVSADQCLRRGHAVAHASRLDYAL